MAEKNDKRMKAAAITPSRSRSIPPTSSDLNAIKVETKKKMPISIPPSIPPNFSPRLKDIIRPKTTQNNPAPIPKAFAVFLFLLISSSILFFICRLMDEKFCFLRYEKKEICQELFGFTNFDETLSKKSLVILV